MNNNPTIPPDSADTAAPTPRPRPEWMRELGFLLIAYFITLTFGSMTIALCGPGCCYVFYSVIAGASGIFMLRRSLFTRILCLTVLLLSLVGMWHEKEARDTWRERALRMNIQALDQELEKSQTNSIPAHPTSGN